MYWDQRFSLNGDPGQVALEHHTCPPYEVHPSGQVDNTQAWTENDIQVGLMLLQTFSGKAMQGCGILKKRFYFWFLPAEVPRHSCSVGDELLLLSSGVSCRPFSCDLPLTNCDGGRLVTPACSGLS